MTEERDERREKSEEVVAGPMLHVGTRAWLLCPSRFVRLVLYPTTTTAVLVAGSSQYDLLWPREATPEASITRHVQDAPLYTAPGLVLTRDCTTSFPRGLRSSLDNFVDCSHRVLAQHRLGAAQAGPIMSPIAGSNVALAGRGERHGVPTARFELHSVRARRPCLQSGQSDIGCV